VGTYKISKHNKRQMTNKFQSSNFNSHRTYAKASVIARAFRPKQSHRNILGDCFAPKWARNDARAKVLSQTNNENELFCILNFGHRILFEICFLMLGVFRGYPMFVNRHSVLRKRYNGSFWGLVSWNLCLVSLLFLIPSTSLAQQNKIDSLINVLKELDKSSPLRGDRGGWGLDTNKVNTLNALAMEFRSNNSDTAVYFAKQALALSQKINYAQGIAEAYLWHGTAIINLGKYDEALSLLNKAIQLLNSPALKGGDKGALSALRGDKGGCKLLARAYNNIGIIYYNQGSYPDALKNHFASLKIKEEIGDKQGIANSYLGIGNIYYNQGNYPDALKNYFASLKIFEEIGDKKGIANSYLGIGIIYEKQDNYPDALKNYFASLSIREEIGDKKGIAASYNNIGIIYERQDNYPDALKNYFASLKIYEEIGDKKGIAASYINIGSANLKLDNKAEAKKYLEDALAISKEIGSKEYIKESYACLAEADSAMGNWKGAYGHHKMYIIYRDSLLNEENTKKPCSKVCNTSLIKKNLLQKQNRKRRMRLGRKKTEEKR
ncbi:MAG: tetratricopeptide repeat protein, partial [Bacteroidota bacterium]